MCTNHAGNIGCSSHAAGESRLAIVAQRTFMVRNRRVLVQAFCVFSAEIAVEVLGRDDIVNPVCGY